MREQRGSPKPRRLVEHQALPIEDLRKSAAPFASTRDGQPVIGLADERRNVRRASAQVLIERPVERALEVLVEEQSGNGQDDGHRQRERSRQPQPDQPRIGLGIGRK